MEVIADAYWARREALASRAYFAFSRDSERMERRVSMFLSWAYQKNTVSLCGDRGG